MLRVAITAVGKRTEHWEGFFAALARVPDLELHLLAADVSELGRRRLEALAAEHASLQFHHAPHVLGEDATGHMASVVFAPGSFGRLHGVRPDVLHVIGEPAYLSTAQAIRFRDRHWPETPISHYAAQNVVIRFPWPFPLLERRAHRKIALALPVTPAAEEVLRAKGYGGPARIVPLGVDRERFTPRERLPQGPFTVGFVGRLERHKGVADLVTAAERAGVRLLLAGDGSLRPWLESEAARRPGSIELAGWVDHDELPGLLHRVHALALPSVEILQSTGIPLREQFGRVLVEAMASGVPVVATRVGEIPFVVGDTGLLVPPGDADALAGAFTELRDHPDRAERLSRAALARSGRFGWDTIAAETVAAWSELAGKPAPHEVRPARTPARRPSIPYIHHQKASEETMETTSSDITTTMAAIRRRAWIVLLSALVAVAAGYGATRLMPVRYESTATLFVNGDGGSNPAAGVDTAALAQRLAGSYARLAESRSVAAAVARAAGLPEARVIGHIEASAPVESQLITLTGSAATATDAAVIANGAAEALAKLVGELTSPRSPVAIEQIDPASAPAAPVSPRVGLSLLFAAFAGLAIGVALAALRERLDDRIRGADVAERALGLPVLASVPRLGRRARKASAPKRHGSETVAEPHRMLAAAVGRLADQEGVRCILVTAPRGEKDKATVAGHLALALAEDNVRTAVIEADLRRPALRREFAVESTPDLRELLGTVNGRLPDATAVHPGLKLLAPERSMEDSGAVLRSAEFAHVLDVARRDSDLVVIEGPGTLGLSDAGVLARHADAAIIVATAGASHIDEVRATRSELERLGLRVAGIVLTGAR